MQIQLNDEKINQLINHQKVNQSIGKISEIENQIDKEIKIRDRIIQKTQKKCQSKIDELQKNLGEITHTIAHYCQKNRKTLTKNYKLKSVQFETGKVQWRKIPLKINIENPEKVLEICQMKKIKTFIRTKYEINRQAMKNEPEKAEKIQGVNVIRPKEKFIVKAS